MESKSDVPYPPPLFWYKPESSLEPAEPAHLSSGGGNAANPESPWRERRTNPTPTYSGSTTTKTTMQSTPNHPMPPGTVPECVAEDDGVCGGCGGDGDAPHPSAQARHVFI